MLRAGASRVMITGVAADAGRLRIARAIGAVPVNIDEQDPLAVLQGLQRDGADVVYETSGVAETLDQGVAMTRKGGSLIFVRGTILDGEEPVLTFSATIKKLRG